LHRSLPQIGRYFGNRHHTTVKYACEKIEDDIKNDDSLKSVIDKFKNISCLDDFKITNIDLKDGVKLMFGEKTKILVRPSGTEPLLRIYFEAESQEVLEKLIKSVEKYIAGQN
jgi:phosphomannomutase